MQTTFPGDSTNSASGNAASPAPAIASVDAPVRQPPKLVALGDSVVYGYGDPELGGWAERLRRRWMGQGLMPNSCSVAPVLYNLGVRGDGVIQVTKRLEAEFAQRGELRNQTPDGIILSVGVNDSAQLGRVGGRNYLSFERFEVAIAQLLEQSQRLAPVYFVGMTPVSEAKMPFMDCFYYNHEQQRRYKEATRKACESRRIPYLDLFEQWVSRGELWCEARLCADGLHPNTQGHDEILQAVLAWDAIRDLEGMGIA